MKDKKTFTLKATGGKWSREEALKTFSWIGSDIEEYGCAHDDADAAKTAVSYGRMYKDGTFIDMFGADPKCFTKAQVLEIVTGHPELLNGKGYGNFFPYRNSKGERFVLDVYRNDSDWGLSVIRLDRDLVWPAKDVHVLFLPATDAYEPYAPDTLTAESPEPLTDESAIAFLKQKGFKITRLEEKEY